MGESSPDFTSTQQALRVGGFAVIETLCALGARSATDVLLIALASSAEDPALRTATLRRLPELFRTGHDLLHFCSLIEQHRLRGWGTQLRAAIAAWYDNQPLAYLQQTCKEISQVSGWNHKRVIQKCHPRAEQHQLFYRRLCL